MEQTGGESESQRKRPMRHWFFANPRISDIATGAWSAPMGITSGG
jgi:hypothetical protein